MHSPNTTGYNPEIEQRNPEAFMPLDHMQHLVADTLVLSGRVDEDGIIQPVRIGRHKGGQGYQRLEDAYRTDIFIPSAEDKSERVFEQNDGTQIWYTIDEAGVGPALYDRLTNRRDETIGIDEVEYLAGSARYLEEVVGHTIDYDLEYSTDFSEKAFFIRAKAEAPGEIEPTRIYIPSGLDAMSIAAAVVGKGADFDTAKLWIPAMAAYKQKLRDDAPLFQVTSIAQLKSVVGALRELSAEGRLPALKPPIVGHEIPGLPGVYIGQNTRGESFNGRMRELFTPALEEAAQDFDLGAGDQVTPDILAELSKKTIRNAMRDAHHTGTHPEDHAFLMRQPIKRIKAAIAE